MVLRVAALQTSDLVNLVEPLLDIEAFVSPQLTLEHAESALLGHFSECNGLWVWMCKNYPDAVATVGPTLLEDLVRVSQFDLD